MLKKLREKLTKIAKQMRSLHATAEEEDRGFSAEEQETWNQLLADYDETEERIKRAEQVESLNDIGPAESRARLPGFDSEGNEDDSDDDREVPNTAHEGRALPEYRAAYDAFLRNGPQHCTPEQRRLMRDYRANMGENFEQRAQQVATDAAGGYTVPEGFAGYITERMVDFSGLYGAAQGAMGPELLRTASGNTIPFPTNDDTGNSGAILAEGSQVTEQDTVFGVRNLVAYMYTSRLIRVSLQLLQDEAVNLERYLGNILGKRLGRAVSPHFARGTGSGQPTGLVTAATDGGVNISAAAGITHVDLLDLEHALDPAYRNAGAQWTFNDTTLRAIKGLNDANNRPLWLPGDASISGPGAGSALMGYEYVIDQGLQDVGVGNRPIAFGQLSEFMIREVLGVTLFRFAEKYMDYLQIGFMGYARFDSNLIDTSAVVTDIVVT